MFKLTGEHVTDATNASRTLLFDIAEDRWDGELLELFGVPERALPRVQPSAGPFGHTHADALPGGSVLVAGVAGDQQAALFGQACVDPGMGKNTYGTGSFVLINAGFQMPQPPAGAARDGRLRGRTALARTRWRRRSSRPARPCSGCATAWASSSAPSRPRCWRASLRATTASTSCRR